MCNECNGPVCSECDGCEHDDEDMKLPVVNSPRWGICGYDGTSRVSDDE